MNKFIRSLAALLLLSALGSPLSSALSQGTAFTYQGRLDDGANPANGSYDMRFALYDDATAGTTQGSILTKLAVPVSNGLFTVEVDFGNQFPGANRWLALSVRTNGAVSLTPLTPRQPITATPYSITAANLAGTLTSANLSGVYANAVTLNNVGNSFSGSGAGLSGLKAANLVGAVPAGALTSVPSGSLTGTVTDARLTANVALLDRSPQTFSGINFFQNSVGIGMTNPGAYPLRVNGNVRLGNRLTGGRSGAQYDEMGYNLGFTTTNDTYTYLDGDTAASIRLGHSGDIEFRTAPAGLGGASLTLSNRMIIKQTGNVGIGTNAPQARLHVVGTIIGGQANSLHVSSTNSSILGGRNNTILSNAPDSTIVGGRDNDIQNDQFSAFIGGGARNQISLDNQHAVIVGGRDNRIGTNTVITSVVGGAENVIGNNVDGGVMVGGFRNDILGSTNANEGQIAPIIVGGSDNQIGLGRGSSWTVILGGDNNQIGTNCASAVILGGTNNIIAGGATHSLAAGTRCRVNHPGVIMFADSRNSSCASTATNQFNVRATGGARIVTGIDGAGTPTAGVSLDAGDTSWNVISDREAKKNLGPVDVREILDRLAQQPVQHWNYKWESDDAVPHIGPMAQDFKAAFFPGRDEKQISTLEFDGVALAAIQGLNEKVEARSKHLEAENAALKRRLEKLEALLEQRPSSGR